VAGADETLYPGPDPRLNDGNFYLVHAEVHQRSKLFDKRLELPDAVVQLDLVLWRQAQVSSGYLLRQLLPEALGVVHAHFCVVHVHLDEIRTTSFLRLSDEQPEQAKHVIKITRNVVFAVSVSGAA
jgi:hypothetical protein